MNKKKTTIKSLLINIVGGVFEYGFGFLNWEVSLEQHPDWRVCKDCKEDKNSLYWGSFYSKHFIKMNSSGSFICFPKEKAIGIEIH